MSHTKHLFISSINVEFFKKIGTFVKYNTVESKYRIVYYPLLLTSVRQVKFSFKLHSNSFFIVISVMFQLPSYVNSFYPKKFLIPIPLILQFFFLFLFLFISCFRIYFTACGKKKELGQEARWWFNLNAFSKELEDV